MKYGNDKRDSVKELDNAISRTSIWLKELMLLRQQEEKKRKHLVRVK